ncbi:copper chaperone PCu(A)C [Xanthobacter sp. TB0136]|uniref:copper chaperone PCu(A)C n=1 Tax=Xanthobacter sp. TB0136 TaxID=3459177 RepID=UPI0040395091
MFQRFTFGASLLAVCTLPVSVALACEAHQHSAAGHDHAPAAQVAQAAPASHGSSVGTHASAHSQDVVKIGALEITGPWSRATPGGAKVAAGYMQITNTGQTPDRLTGGTSAFSERVEIHEMTMENGVMRMRPLPDGLDIAPGQSVKLEPGGYHIMFMGLKEQLKEGESVKGTLTFSKAGTADVTYQVRGLAAGGHHKGH